ncbi:hypothetical protein [Photobacterium leiognathi]|uniref:hypothetical protein n=1 Tax=Photobacterium leiognathi TaxID=553611 RepID=UPI000ABA59EA|nr:hypothetical protein [Photobacterium leiognathi]
MRSSVDQYDPCDWPDITDHYIGIVGEMPLYSTSEQVGFLEKVTAAQRDILKHEAQVIETT